MIDIRPFAKLGKFRNAWLNANYHFSFANYYNPNRMGFGPLLVWNDDTIRAGTGFDPHPHRDMEIITYVRTGAITHKDNQGNEGRTGAGDVQVMWAGKGIVHSEYNLESEDTTLFQIWIETAQKSIKPGWDARAFPKDPGSLRPLASGRDLAGHEDALRIHQDAAILGGVLVKDQEITLPMDGRKLYLVPTTGALEVNGERVEARDGIAVDGLKDFTFKALEQAEVVVADVAA
ncbi:MAG: pirin family protein [Rhodospirillum sp.]|nr:pirin family protein [Rhodospirillum sp.]MCF8488733.1 pirin family protein [Rhodospirillum sp.]MCF8503070.1 pirin family protein [Rhodospirillum sp.]